MNGRQFIVRVRKWARGRNLEVRFVASEGAGSHETLYAGGRRTTIKDRRKEIGKVLLGKMLADPAIDRDDFQAAEASLPRRTERMPDTYNYPAEIERDEDGRHVVTLPDFGWGATDGASRDEALAEAKELLRELIATTIREGGDLPEPSRPSKHRPLVVPPVQIALKAAVYEAWRDAGISQRRLARELGIAESEVRRILDPEHGTKAATIDGALRYLGKRVTVTVGEAA